MDEAACELRSTLPGAALAAVRRALDAEGITSSTARSGGFCPVVLITSGEATLEEVCGELLDRPDSGRAVVVQVVSETECGLERACALLKAGADELIECGAPSECVVPLAKLIRRWRLIETECKRDDVRNVLVGESALWRRTVRETVEAGRFSSAPVFLHGETGTGKEQLARLVHCQTQRKGASDLTVLDCTTLQKDLAGSELFGHARGAFTGAAGSRIGAMALADGGTLFLDEVGELPLGLQAPLLRALQECTYKPIGSNEWQRSDFRLVCATNRDLCAEVRAGNFRLDLYHRICANTVRVPALRERRGDIPLLLDKFATDAVGDRVSMTPSLLAHLNRRDYPGNVRELQQLVAAMARRYLGNGRFTIGMLPDSERATLLSPATAADAAKQGWRLMLNDVVSGALGDGLGLHELTERIEDALIDHATDKTGSLRRASMVLGVTERALQMRRARRSERGQPRASHNGNGHPRRGDRNGA